MVVDGAPSLSPTLYSVFLFLTNTMKWKHLQSKGKTWGEMFAVHTRRAQLLLAHTFHTWWLMLWLPSPSRVAINTLGPSGVRDPEGSQRGRGLIASRRWGHAKFWSNYARDTCYCNHTRLVQRPGRDCEWMSGEAGLVQSWTQQSWELRHVGAPSGARLRGYAYRWKEDKCFPRNSPRT